MLTLSHFLTRRILHLRYYCWLVISRATADVNLLECALLVACGLCPFDPFTPVKVESSLLNGHSLFLSSPWYNRTRLTGRKTPTYLLLSLSLSSLSLTHSYCTFSLSLSLPHSKWEQFSCLPVSHGLRTTQSHLFDPLTIHASIRLQKHSHSTDHSLISQAHAIIPLHKE